MVGICFFYGTSLPALLVRLRTWRRGQRWCDVPAHVGIIAGSRPEYFEAIVSGVRSTHALPSASVRPVTFAIPDEAALVAYLRDQVGEPYDWAAIIDDTVGRTLPWDVIMRRKRRHDCSGLVTDALLVGGVVIPHQDLPETPNDLLHALEEILGVSLYQRAKSPERTHPMFNPFDWLKNRALKLPQADDAVVDKTLGVPAGTTAALNTEAVDVLEGDAAAAIEKAVVGK